MRVFQQVVLAGKTCLLLPGCEIGDSPPPLVQGRVAFFFFRFVAFWSRRLLRAAFD